MKSEKNHTAHVLIFVACMGLLAGMAQFLNSCAGESRVYDESYDPREEGQYERGWP